MTTRILRAHTQDSVVRVYAADAPEGSALAWEGAALDVPDEEPAPATVPPAPWRGEDLFGLALRSGPGGSWRVTRGAYRWAEVPRDRGEVRVRYPNGATWEGVGELLPAVAPHVDPPKPAGSAYR